MDILSISGPAISLKTKHFWKAVFCTIFGCSLLFGYQGTKTATPSRASDFPKFDASALPITARIHIGGDPDWLAIGFGSVWVSVPKNNEIVRINPATNLIEARIKVGEEPCYGIGVGETHVWVLNCKSQTLTRIRPQDNTVDQTKSVHIAPHGEGAIAVVRDVVWYVGNEDGHSNTLLETNARKAHMLAVGADSAVVNAGFGSIWVTSSGDGKVYRVAPKRHKIIAQISVPASPRFTTIGEGSVWVLSQSDGSVSRIDPATNKVIANIAANVPGAGGDIAYGGGMIWVAASGTPVMRIDPKTNKVIDQYGNYKGADAIRFGFGSVWVSDHGKGDLWRIDPQKLGH
jgi:YVTN family beta-propeller protein